MEFRGSTDNPDAAAVVQAAIDITASVGLLVAGANLLAIHGLNGTIDSSDLLISVELSATKGTPASAHCRRCRLGPPVCRADRAPQKHRGQGTDSLRRHVERLNEAVFAVGPVAQNLRVSEIMYHPADTGNPNDPNTEFIELTNIAGQSINLNLVRFTDGIDYTFPSFQLPAGGYCLVVKDLTAFQAKYGSKLPVRGVCRQSGQWRRTH